MSSTKRISMTIPESLVSDLDFISYHFQVSRSSLISELLTTSVSDVRRIMEMSIQLTDSGDSKAPLSRDPSKVRSYLNSMRAAQENLRERFDAQYEAIASEFEGSKNEH